MPKLIYHVDDSKIAQRLFKEAAQTADSTLQLKLFQSAKDLIAQLENIGTSSPDQIPDAIFTDQVMPGMDGIELVSWIKSHPRFHQLPMVMLTAESQEHRKKKAFALGVNLMIEKPVAVDAVKNALVEIEKHQALPRITRETEVGFTIATMEMIQRSLAAIPSLTLDQFHAMKKQLGHIKGESYTVQYPVIGEFIQDLEAILDAIEIKKMVFLPKSKEFLILALDYVREHLRAIQDEVAPRPPSSTLKKLLSEFDRVIKEGHNPSGSKSEVLKDAAPISSDGIFTRLQNTEIQTLHTHVDKIIQVGRVMGDFARTLIDQIKNDELTKDLESILAEFTEHTKFLLEFFTSIRMTSVKDLVAYTKSIVDEASAKLGREITIDCHFDEVDTMDSEVMSRVELGILHIVRNSADHGFEGREKGNHIQMKIEKLSADRYEIVLKDNGKGIDSDRLLKSLLRKGDISNGAVKGWSHEKLLNLIFIDGISTKEQATVFSGRGVGLGEVRNEIKQIGGEIQVKSELGAGTEFRIEVPKAVPETTDLAWSQAT